MNYNPDSIMTKRIHISNIIVLMILMLSIAIFIIISYNSNSIPKATASLNETASTDISNNNSKTTTVPINLEENVLLYEAIGNVVGTRVLNVIGEPQLEYSIVENGTITGIGNVTNIQTWIDTLRTPKVTYGEGKGIMITDNGQRATWVGYDIGQLQNNGSIIYKGITIFNDNATEDMAFLNNLVGLHITKVEGNNQATKIWKWQ